MDYIFEGDGIVADFIMDEDLEKESVEVKAETTPKKKTKTKKISAHVNYSKPKQHKTSISYQKNGRSYAVFVDGIYDGEIEIEYSGKEFSAKNIVSIK